MDRMDGVQKMKQPNTIQSSLLMTLCALLLGGCGYAHHFIEPLSGNQNHLMILMHQMMCLSALIRTWLMDELNKLSPC